MTEQQIEAAIVAARSVVSDVLAMSADDESFGPFSGGRVGWGRYGEEHFVEWPNLAISLRRLNEALHALGRDVS